MLKILRTLRRILKWKIELSKFKINFRFQIAIEGQTFAYFIFKFSFQVNLKYVQQDSTLQCLNELNALGILLISLEGQRFHNTLGFGFKASKNEAKCKVILVGLSLEKYMGARLVNNFSDQ